MTMMIIIVEDIIARIIGHIITIMTAIRAIMTGGGIAITTGIGVATMTMMMTIDDLGQSDPS